MPHARHFGEYFKKQRQEKGLTLREIENATSIRAIYLEGIEEGKIAQMLSPVYAKGFVRQYASFLGLDGDRFIQEYAHLFKKAQKTEEVLGVSSFEERSGPRNNPGDWIPTAVLAGASFLVLFFAYLLASYFDLV